MEFSKRDGLTRTASDFIAKAAVGLRARGRRPRLWLIAAVLSLTAAGLAGHVYGRREAPARANPAPPGAAATAPPAAPRLQSGSLHGEIITLLPHGFDPPEITKASGEFILLVDNHSGVEGLDLRLGVEGAVPLYSAQVPATRIDWTETVELPKGTYVLTEANHPDWVCTITITGE